MINDLRCCPIKITISKANKWCTKLLSMLKLKFFIQNITLPFKQTGNHISKFNGILRIRQNVQHSHWKNYGSSTLTDVRDIHLHIFLAFSLTFRLNGRNLQHPLKLQVQLFHGGHDFGPRSPWGRRREDRGRRGVWNSGRLLSIIIWPVGGSGETRTVIFSVAHKQKGWNFEVWLAHETLHSYRTKNMSRKWKWKTAESLEMAKPHAKIAERHTSLPQLTQSLTPSLSLLSLF